MPIELSRLRFITLGKYRFLTCTLFSSNFRRPKVGKGHGGRELARTLSLFQPAVCFKDFYFAPLLRGTRSGAKCAPHREASVSPRCLRGSCTLPVCGLRQARPPDCCGPAGHLTVSVTGQFPSGGRRPPRGPYVRACVQERVSALYPVAAWASIKVRWRLRSCAAPCNMEAE